MGDTQRNRKRDYQRQRQELMTHLRILLEELEDRPAHPKSMADFPFNILENTISRMILSLEALIAGLVSVSLDMFRKQRER